MPVNGMEHWVCVGGCDVRDHVGEGYDDDTPPEPCVGDAFGVLFDDGGGSGGDGGAVSMDVDVHVFGCFH